jgi:peroxiredoxin Q/BCP
MMGLGALLAALWFQVGSAGTALSPSDLNRIKVGDKAPDFRLQAAGGRTLRLSGFRGKTVVLVFYRGYW